MLKKITLIMLFISGTIFSQSRTELDLQYEQYLKIKQAAKYPLPETPSDTEFKKCGFEIVNSVRANFDKYTPGQQQVLSSLFQRKVKNKSIVSPSGLFRIHYDIAGTDAPSYILSLTPDENAMLVAEALDSTFRYQVNFAGYLPPPPDKGKGGDDLYDVYIEHLGGQGLYGYTEFEEEITPGSRKFISFMVIDNDYTGSYYTRGIDGARVTCAHELHHAIQGGGYVLRNADLFYYEISSTAMEEFVYDSINDYYAYLRSYFDNPQLAIPLQNGYNLAILNIFLEARYDHSLLKRIWELMVQDTALVAINKALIERNSSFSFEYNLFGIWIYFTSSRAIEGKYFEEAASYPALRPLQTINFSSPSHTVNGNSAPTGQNIIDFTTSRGLLSVIISNSDFSSASSNPLITQNFRYTLYDYPAEGSIKLTELFYMNFQAARPNFWQTTEILNGQIIKDGLQSQIIADFPFPSPYHYGRNYHTGQFIFIPVEANEFNEVEFSVYSTSMDQVFQSLMPVLFIPGNIHVVRWNGLNTSNDKLSSGIYLYIIKSGDDIKKGKLVIFND